MAGISGVDSQLLGPLFTTDAMRDAFSDRARLQAMLDVEAALARAQARTGVIPAQSVAAIEAAARAELYDLAELGRATALAGNPAIPLVKAMTAQAGEAGRFVHWGATSQDVIDTALVLQMRHGLELIEADMTRLGEALAELAREHRETVLSARTFLQQALPTTLGAKAAVQLDALTRHRQRLEETRGRCVVLSFAGAAGTLASLGERAPAVGEALAAELSLLVVAPWHTARDRLVEVGTLLAMLAGTAAKVALDVALLMQTEVGEAFEAAGAGRGGSSTMPHKRNPAQALGVIASARAAAAQVPVLLQAMAAEHERALGGWHAEWTALPLAFCHTAGALSSAADIVAGLEVDAERMRANLDGTRGLGLAESLMMALAPAMGRLEAHHLVEDLCRTAARARRHLREVALADAMVSGKLSPQAIGEALDPALYTGLATTYVDQALAAWAVRPGALS